MSLVRQECIPKRGVIRELENYLWIRFTGKIRAKKRAKKTA
jgi:hypothetical protein